MVREVAYPGEMPEELKHLHYYVADTGHAIMAVPKCFEGAAKAGKYWEYEVPLPVKYVIEKGWEKIDGTDAVTVDVEYDDMLGVMVPDGSDEF